MSFERTKKQTDTQTKITTLYMYIQAKYIYRCTVHTPLSLYYKDYSQVLQDLNSNLFQQKLFQTYILKL